MSARVGATCWPSTLTMTAVEQLRLFERPAGNASDMRVELAERACLDGVMAGIVRSRSQLVDDHLVVLGDEQFDGQECWPVRSPWLSSNTSPCASPWRRSRPLRSAPDGHVQDVVAMLVAHDWEGHVVLAVAGDEDARFEREVDESFQNARRVLRRHGRRGRTSRFTLDPYRRPSTARGHVAGTAFEHRRVMDLVDTRRAPLRC